MKKGFKRLLSGILAVVMVLSLVMVSPLGERNLVDAATEGIITDGEFADSTNFQTNWSPAVANWTDDATIWQKEGYLNIWNGTEAANAMSITQNITIPAGIYKISVDVCGTEGESGLTLTLKKDSVDLVAPLEIGETGSTYTTLSTEVFEVTEETTATLSLGGDIPVGNWANVDNLVITEYSWENATNIITDGEFSDGTNYQTNWAPAVANWTDNATIWQKEGYLNIWNGTEAANAMSITQNITIPAGNYKISVDVCGTDGESGLALTLKKDSVDLVAPLEIGETGSAYTTLSSEVFEVTEETTAALSLGGDVPVGNWANVDNLAIYQLKEKTTEENESGNESEPESGPESGNQPEAEIYEIENGDFEQDTHDNKTPIGWSIADSSKAGIRIEQASGSKNSTLTLNLSNNGSGVLNISKTVEGVPAGQYYLQFEKEGAAAESGLSVIVSAGDKELSKKEVGATTGWDSWETVNMDSFTLDEATDVTITISGEMPESYWGHFDNFVFIKGTNEEDSESGTPVETPDPVEAGIKVDYVNGITDDFITGVDVSSYVSEKNSGVKYYDFDGNELSDQEFFDFLADCGVNYIRIRVWHNPYDADGNGYGGGNNDLETAKQIGQWASKAGMKVLVDFHYSDFWTDPGKQYTPKAWEGLSVADKADELYDYTVESLTYLIDNGVDVGMVQVGNETNKKFCGESDWDSICTLFSAGAEGVRDVAKNELGETKAGEKILIALHFADPQNGAYPDYAKELDSHGVDYDVFASSYYPFFHGTTSNLTSVLTNIGDTYGKKVMVAETSWATSLEDGDGHDNQIREGNNDEEFYDFSVYGQAQEIRTVVDAVVKASGIGVFYWEPAWLPVQVYDAEAENADEILAENREIWEEYGSGWAASYGGEYQKDAADWYGGTAMDNQAMFDFTGHPLESILTYKYLRTGTTVPASKVDVSRMKAEDVTVAYSDEITLPETVIVTYTDGTSDDAVAVSWSEDDIAEAKANGLGIYTITGTAKILGESREVSCKVTIEPDNYLTNPGLEEDDPETAWTIDNTDALGRVSDNNVRNGNYSLKFWYDEAFEFTATRQITLNKGYYNFGTYLQGGDSGEDAVYTFGVKVGTGNEVTVNGEQNGWNNWDNLEIQEVEIAEDNTTVTIAVYGKNIAAGGWGSFDDFYINKLCKVTYKDGETSIGTEFVPIGGKAAVPEYTKAGYEVTGWNGTLINLTKDTVVSVILEAISYTITYELNGGSNANANPTEYTIEDEVTFADATKAGYTFAGWYTDAKFTTAIDKIKAGTIGDITVYAKWTANETASDNEDSNDGSDQNEDDTNKTPDQENPSTGENSSVGESESVSPIVAQIKATDAGKTIALTVGKDGMTTVVTKDILEAAKAGKVNLVIDMGEYTWTIKADSIKTVKDVDLRVILDTKEIPEDKIKALGKNISYRQLSLVYDGEFGFTATLTVNVGAENKGKYGNLYYYNDKKELEFVDSAVIGTNGNVSLEFTHASDYVIVIGDNMKVNDTNTGDHTPILPFAMVMMIGFAMVVFVVARRRNAK